MGGVLPFHQGNQVCLTVICHLSDTPLPPLYSAVCHWSGSQKPLSGSHASWASVGMCEWEEAAEAGERRGRSRSCPQLPNAAEGSGGSTLVAGSAFWRFPLESELLDKDAAADTGLWAPAQLIRAAHLCGSRVLPFGFPRARSFILGLFQVSHYLFLRSFLNLLF